MPANLQSSKLAELRAKTDHDLVSIIDNSLENALLLADVEPDVDAAGVLHRRGAQIYADMSMLVTLTENLQERLRLEEKLKHLDDALDLQVRMHAASASA